MNVTPVVLDEVDFNECLTAMMKYLRRKLPNQDYLGTAADEARDLLIGKGLMPYSIDMLGSPVDESTESLLIMSLMRMGC